MTEDVKKIQVSRAQNTPAEARNNKNNRREAATKNNRPAAKRPPKVQKAVPKKQVKVAAQPKKIVRKKDARDAKIYVYDRFYQKLPLLKRLNSRTVLAIDLDTDKLRYAVGRKSGDDIQIIKWGSQKFPSEEKDRRKALQIALENIKVKVHRKGMVVSVSIFSPEISIRQIVFPKINKKNDLEEALFHKNESDLKNFDQDAIWNYQILDEFEEEGIQKMLLTIVAVPGEVVNYYTTIFDNVGLQLKQIIPRPAAIQGAYRKMVFRPGRDLVIDIEYDLTQICFLKNGEVQLIRNVSIGARNLEVSIHDQNTEPEKESRLKIEMPNQKPAGGDVSSGLRSKLLQKINDLKTKQNPVLHTFFSEILRSMAYIQGRDIQHYIERIFITGYGIRKESLFPYLKSRLSLPLFILTPQFTQSDTRTLDYGEYFSTLGTVQQENPVFNLLPKWYKVRAQFKKLNALLVTFAIPLFIFLGYVSYKQNIIIEQKKMLVAQYQKQYDQLNPIEGKFNEVLKEIDLINKKNKELKGYVTSRPPLVETLKLFSNKTPKEIRFENVTFNYLKTDKNKKNILDKFRNNYMYQIDITGTIYSDPVLSDVKLIEYINMLIGLKYFKNVQLLNKLKDPEAGTTQFTIRFYL